MLTDVSHPEDFIVSYYGLARFEIAFSAKAIRVFSTDGATEETIRHLLTDQILPRVIAHEGHHVLHAGAVITPGGAIIIAGPSGSGKSTLAAAFHVAGYPLLGDDATIVWQEYGMMKCQAVYRSLRLLPDSLSALFDDSSDLTPVAQYTRKQNVHLGEPEQLDSAYPVCAVFFLEPATGEQIEVRRIGAADLCMKLIEHGFWMDPEDLKRAGKRLQHAGEFATNVPAFEMRYQRELSQLPDLRRTIFEMVGTTSQIAQGD